MSLAEGRGTIDPYLSRILLARQINNQVGGMVVAPWEIDDLPEDWIIAFRALLEELPSISAGKQKIEAIREKWLASHPTYNVRH